MLSETFLEFVRSKWEGIPKKSFLNEFSFKVIFMHTNKYKQLSSIRTCRSNLLMYELGKSHLNSLVKG